MNTDTQWSIIFLVLANAFVALGVVLGDIEAGIMAGIFWVIMAVANKVV